METGLDNIYFLVVLGMAGTLLLAAGIVMFYIRYHRKMMRQQETLRQAELAHQGELMIAGIQSQEEERRRIGRDLHDGVGGALSNLRFVVSRIGNAKEQPAGHADTPEECKKMIDDIINNVRTISHNLSPPGLELFGLNYTIEELCYQTEKATGIGVELEDHCQEDAKSIPFTTSLSIYRVLQELMNNTVKHAQASGITVIMEMSENCLQIQYRDNGKGFDATLQQGKGMGMSNLESRLNMVKAVWHYSSSPGKGFDMQIKVPLEHQ